MQAEPAQAPLADAAGTPTVPVVASPAQHRAAMALISTLMDAPAGSADFQRLVALATLVQAYERDAFPSVPLSPRDAILFSMEQNGRSQVDLARALGSRSRASEIMRGRRPQLSLAMIQRLSDAWGIPTALLVGARVPKAKPGRPAARRTRALKEGRRPKRRTDAKKSAAGTSLAKKSRRKKRMAQRRNAGAATLTTARRRA